MQDHHRQRPSPGQQRCLPLRSRRQSLHGHDEPPHPRAARVSRRGRHPPQGEPGRAAHVHVQPARGPSHGHALVPRPYAREHGPPRPGRARGRSPRRGGGRLRAPRIARGPVFCGPPPRHDPRHVRRGGRWLRAVELPHAGGELPRERDGHRARGHGLGRRRGRPRRLPHQRTALRGHPHPPRGGRAPPHGPRHGHTLLLPHPQPPRGRELLHGALRQGRRLPDGYTPYLTLAHVMGVPGTRSDVGVLCSGPEGAVVAVNATSSDDTEGLGNKHEQAGVFNLVLSSAAPRSSGLTSLPLGGEGGEGQAPLPSYLDDLTHAEVTVPVSGVSALTFTRGNSINNIVWNADVPLESVCLGHVYQLLLVGGGNGGVHPFHLHVNHHQIMTSPIDNPDLVRPGEWRDTTPSWNVVVRFPVLDYVGKQILHCHILQHEDNGMMGWFNMSACEDSS
mmetsp:Transcript_9086/g.30984  ORF Transcript_9086/g.30984 Transcript_9086/m.30984 type:complete len:449 (-) Transcript_9086:171-1517(-)